MINAVCWVLVPLLPIHTLHCYTFVVCLRYTNTVWHTLHAPTHYCCHHMDHLSHGFICVVCVMLWLWSVNSTRSASSHILFDLVLKPNSNWRILHDECNKGVGNPLRGLEFTHGQHLLILMLLQTSCTTLQPVLSSRLGCCSVHMPMRMVLGLPYEKVVGMIW